MNGAEFRVRHEALGLSVNQVAELLGVNRRNVVKWETGEYSRVPEGVIAELRAWEQATDDLVRHLLEELAAEPAPTINTFRDDQDTGLEYPPAWHRRVCARIAERLPNLRIEFAS